jgi:hypothetical protein
MQSTKQKFQHFDMLYHKAIKEYHRNILVLQSVKDYVKGRNSEETDRIYRMFGTDIRQYTNKLNFAEDELRMYKREMQKWRDISTKLERAYWSTDHKIRKIWNTEKDGKFGIWQGDSYNGTDIKLHLRITWYNTTGCHHQVMVSLLDKKFGILTNEQVY